MRCNLMGQTFARRQSLLSEVVESLPELGSIVLQPLLKAAWRQRTTIGIRPGLDGVQQFVRSPDVLLSLGAFLRVSQLFQCFLSGFRQLSPELRSYRLVAVEALQPHCRSVQGSHSRCITRLLSKHHPTHDRQRQCVPSSATIHESEEHTSRWSDSRSEPLPSRFPELCHSGAIPLNTRT